ncbi:hypothetical protein B484DRAFT_415282, partial [Ochromonadaceae sp. CCMP2298]
MTEQITAHPNFKLLATMNPGGDFGKRELSPALRSRFTEIWVPSATDASDVSLIVREILTLPRVQAQGQAQGQTQGRTQGQGTQGQGTFGGIPPPLADRLTSSMVAFMHWMNNHGEHGNAPPTQPTPIPPTPLGVGKRNVSISVREILEWAKFIHQFCPPTEAAAYTALIHGAFMTILDGLGIGTAENRAQIRTRKVDCLRFLLSQCRDILPPSCLDGSAFFLSSGGGGEGGGVLRAIKTGNSFS